MKGIAKDCFNIIVYDLNGIVVKNFYNFPETAAKEVYVYYTSAVDDYTVKIEGTETMYDLLPPVEKKTRR